MAAGFTLKKDNLKIFKDFILKNFLSMGVSTNYTLNYDAEISSFAFNKNFFDDIKKIEPFGAGNPVPTFLFKDLKIIKTTILNNKHISSILKSKIGFSINSISFNSVNSKIGEYLLNYKKDLNVLGQINENFWNNKKTLQLVVRDLII
jgi:single-stranded-DNA-specific exonuclease